MNPPRALIVRPAYPVSDSCWAGNRLFGQSGGFCHFWGKTRVARTGLLGWWREGFGGGLENEALANQREALLGKFSLKELIFRAGE